MTVRARKVAEAWKLPLGRWGWSQERSVEGGYPSLLPFPGLRHWAVSGKGRPAVAAWVERSLKSEMEALQSSNGRPEFGSGRPARAFSCVAGGERESSARWCSSVLGSTGQGRRLPRESGNERTSS